MKEYANDITKSVKDIVDTRDLLNAGTSNFIGKQYETMKASEIFEGENSSLKRTFDKAVEDNRCNQCKLENNLGICDRNDCSNKPITTTMRERFNEKFVEFAPDGSSWGAGLRIKHTGTTQDREVLDNVLDFIEQELKKEREENIAVIQTWFEGEMNDNRGSKLVYEHLAESIVRIINTIKNRV